jgi:hypothetical protein
VKNNVISGNVITGDGTAISTGIQVEQDSGACSGNRVGPNTIVNVTNGVAVYGATNNFIDIGNCVSVAALTAGTWGAGNTVRAVGSGVPAILAGIGSTFQRTDGGATSSFYVKESGDTATTGWGAK